MTGRGWLLAGLLALAVPAMGQTPDPRQVVGAPRGPALSGDALAQRAEEVAGLLRCPVCQGLSVADSPSTMAQNMKTQVKQMLGAGYDQEQVLAYFEGSYGEFVRLKPPLRGINWLVWLGPLAGLAAGGLLVGWAFRRSSARAPQPTVATDLPTAATLPEDARMARYVLRVRELAYGWPGGVPPRLPDPSAPPAGEAT